MGNHHDRDERKARGIALKKQFEELGLSPKDVANKAGWSESYLSRAWNPDEPTVAASAELLECLETVLRKRKRELFEVVDIEHAGVTLVDTCNGAMAKLCDQTRAKMAHGLRSRLFSPAAGPSASNMLPDRVAGALFKLDDGCAETAVYVMVVRTGNDAEEKASLAHELQDLSRDYAFQANKLRRSSGGPPDRPLPKADYKL